MKIELPEGVTEKDIEKLLKKAAKKAPQEGMELFKEIECGHNQVLRVYRDVYKEKEILSIRKFWREDEEQEYKPGKGVTFHFEEIGEIIEGLQAMETWCEENPRA